MNERRCSNKAMLIEDVDALKGWLAKTLQPICDADPVALAKYVVALVKKDKEELELKESCFDQLGVFLQDKTKGFVVTLFEALKSKSYIQAVINSSPPQPPPTAPSKPESRKSSRSEDNLDDHRRKRSHSRSPGRDRERSRRSYDDRRRQDSDRGSGRHSRYDSDYRSRHRTRSRSRSRSPHRRSRSVDRSKHKSRSPDRIPVHCPSDSRGSTPVQDDTKDLRGPVINSEVIVPSHSGYHSRERPPPRPRCRDYDEKGFCMRGDMCPYDHGVDPVILEDVVIPGVPSFGTAGPPPPGPTGPPPGPPGGPHGPPPPGPPGGGPPPHDARGPMPPHDTRGPMPPHDGRGPMPPRDGRGPMPPHDTRGPMPPHDTRGPMPPHDTRGPMPPHHMPPMSQAPPGGPMPPRPMLHHNTPSSRQQPPPPQQGLPPPHPGDHAAPGPPPHGGPGPLPLGSVVVDGSRPPPPPNQAPPPPDFHPHVPPPPSHNQPLPPQQGPPTTHPRRPEYQPEPYNPEAPMLRPNQNDFWRGNHNQGRGRIRGGHGHDRGGRGDDRGGHGHERGGHGHERGGHGHERGGHGHERGGHGHERGAHGHDHGLHGHDREMNRDHMDRVDRMRQPFLSSNVRRDLVSIPTIPESVEEEQAAAAPHNSNKDEGSGVASRIVVPAKRKYELSSGSDGQGGGYKEQFVNPDQAHNMMGGPHQPWGTQGPPGGHSPPSHQHVPIHKKPHFDFKRLGPQRRIHPNSDNCTLELRRVPREHNNIAKLNEHFSKFGHIVNLQVCYDGDGEAALITFLTNSQAKNAYHSTDPILNNRFIKVFWHKPAVAEDAAGTDGAGAPAQKALPKSIKERLGEIPPPHKLQLNNNKTTAAPAPAPTADPGSKKVSPLGLTKTVFNLTAIKKGPVNTRLGTQPVRQQTRQQSLQQRQQLQAGLAQKKKQQDQEMMMKNMAIYKEKQLLLHKQINKQKLLIGKLEKSKVMSGEDRTKIMKTIKSIAETIEKLKTDLMNSALPKVTATTVKVQQPKTKQQAQKEILDTELDIISKQNEGADTSALRRRVAALKKEASVLGLLGPGFNMRGRGSPRARGRGASRGGRGAGRGAMLSVDRRPKQLLVSGYPPEDKDIVLELLSKDGGVETVLHDDAANTMVITFQARLLAEQAIKAAADYDKAPLSLSWYRVGPSRDPASGVVVVVAATPAPSLQDEALLTEVTGQVLSRHNSQVLQQKQEQQQQQVADVQQVVVGGAEPLEGEEEDDDDEEDVLRVGEAEDEENMPAGIEDHELDEEMDEDLLLGVDEEEDDEEEGRSWRR